MARVEISSMPWGTLWDRAGNVKNGETATLKNLDGTNATTWSAITGGSSSTASLTADANGNLPRFVEGGQYTLDVPILGITGRRVEAVSGSVESGIGDAASAAQDYTPSRNGSSLTIWSKPQRINPHSSTYGAVGDGTTNDSTALAAALTRANVLGAVVALSGADYKLNTALDGTLAPIEGRGRGKTRLVVGTGLSNLITINGSQASSNTATLTSDAARFTSTLALSTVSGLAAGDWLLLGSSGIFQNDHTDHLPGERVQIKSIASLVVTLTHPIRDTYLVADSAAVKKLTDTTGARISGLTFHNPNPLANNVSGLYVQHHRDLGLSDVGFSQLDGQGIQLVNVSRATIDGLFLTDLADDPDNSRFGYGLLLQRGTEFVTVNGGVAHGCRHVITTDGTVGQWGVARSCTINGMESHAAGASAFDTHAHSEQIHFIGCHAIGARDFAFHHRAKFSTVQGGSASDCRGGAFLEADAIRTEINGTKFERLGWIPNRPTDTSTAWDAGAVGIQMNGVEQTIRNCEIAGVACQAIVASANKATIRRNVIKQACLNSDGTRTGGSVGGSLPLTVIESSTGAANPYIRDNEYHADTTLATYKGFEVTTTATVVIKIGNVNGVALDNWVYGSGITPFQAPTGFTGTRRGNRRVDESGAIQSRIPLTLTKADALLGGAVTGNHANSGKEYIEFADAATQTAVYLVRLPYEGAFDGSKISVQPHWSSPTAGGGNVRWQCKASVLTDNSDMTVAPTTAIATSMAASATAHGKAPVQVMDFGSALTITPNRLLLLHFSRLGSDVLDTLNTAVARLAALDVLLDAS